MTHHLVVLDGYTLNPGDLSWSELQQHTQTTIYDRTAAEEVIERAATATLLLTNKVVIDRDVIAHLPSLQCICVSATGYNVVDTVAAAERSIPVCNVVGYGSTSVAQHVFALLLELTNRVALHDNSVQKGEWSRAPDWCYWKSPLVELSGRTMGIYGMGKIGGKVADIALGFGMKVLSTHKHPVRDARPGVRFVEWQELLEESDVLTLHAPLSEDNRGIINKKALESMKSSAYLINTGRGGLVVEKDLRAALDKGAIAGAGLDVLSTEPPPIDNVLIGAKNCILTPHQAWATKASRQRLLTAVSENVAAFIAGRPQNVVNS